MTPKYTFVEGKESGEYACRIDEGVYKGVVFKYGEVDFNEIENEQLKLSFNYYVFNGINLIKDEKDFKRVAGDVLVDLLDNHLSEGIDDGNDRDNHSEELGTD
jgi:hypothetical protein|tara:strand:+ start:54 stop:362 length:309 start_codon:yes stop_codon:yes gene_type:complete